MRGKCRYKINQQSQSHFDCMHTSSTWRRNVYKWKNSWNYKQKVLFVEIGRIKSGNSTHAGLAYH